MARISTQRWFMPVARNSKGVTHFFLFPVSWETTVAFVRHNHQNWLNRFYTEHSSLVWTYLILMVYNDPWIIAMIVLFAGYLNAYRLWPASSIRIQQAVTGRGRGMTCARHFEAGSDVVVQKAASLSVTMLIHKRPEPHWNLPFANIKSACCMWCA